MSAIPGPPCGPCLERLVAATLAGCGLDGPANEALRAQMLGLAHQGLAEGHTPAVIASRFLALARQRSGVNDPFAAQKQRDFVAARQAAAALADLPDTFAARAKAAIVGNAFDHFLVADRGELWRAGADLALGVDDLAKAEALLRPGGLVAVLADNCGEQSFDRLLVGHLLGRGCRVAYVVKSGPAQNDLTLDDLARQGENYGLGRVVGTGSEQVGLDPGRVPGPLADLLATADLVIAKGMGHYETMRPRAGLWPTGGPPWPLLLLFLAKCQPVAASLGLQRGQGVALLVEPRRPQSDNHPDLGLDHETLA